MATGIFSTTRVAGEGVALAIVSALLSTFIQSDLGASGGGHAAMAAQQLVTGDLAAAASSVPAIGHDALVQGYGHAFGTLLWLLTGITVLTAVVVFSFLGRSPASTVAEDAEPPEEDDEDMPRVSKA
jgi:hypothetical protein